MREYLIFKYGDMGEEGWLLRDNLNKVYAPKVKHPFKILSTIRSPNPGLERSSLIKNRPVCAQLLQIWQVCWSGPYNRRSLVSDVTLLRSVLRQEDTGRICAVKQC
jgi:hypothetical protein